MMATPFSAIQQTAFPKLDTLVADDRYHGDVVKQYHHRKFSYVSDAAAHPKGKNDILQGFSRFIAAFTGEPEVNFQFALRIALQEFPQRSIVHSVVAHEQAKEGDEQSKSCFINISQQPDCDDEVFDFGVEVLTDPEDFDSISVPAFLECPFLLQYHAMQMTIVLRYDIRFMDDDFADGVIEVLVNHLSRKSIQFEPGKSQSLLNYPPALRPPSIPYIQTGEGPTGLLHSGVKRTADQYPTRHALHFLSDPADFVLTYAELDDLTLALAMKIRSCLKGAQGQIIVPAYMTPSPAFYVSWLAVLKAGFAFCPLPVDAPPSELQAIVEEVCATLVLINGPKIGGSPWDAWYCDGDELTACMDVEDFIRSWIEKPFTPEQTLPNVAETDLAYIMYTSGSTGMPKGVKISHLSAACAIATHSKFIPAHMSKRGFRWFQYAPLTFDPSVMEMFVTWWTGGTLCAGPRDVVLTNPEGAINRLKATIMMATPHLASSLRPQKMPTLRNLWTMGERLTPRVIENFSGDSSIRSSPPSPTSRPEKLYKLLNAYGPTEASINCAVVSDFSVEERGSVIGQPIDTCSILIIDPNKRRPVPVPLGFSGELAIGGPQVSQGYINRPEQTAASFINNSEHGRLYRTGDRARVVRTKQGEYAVEILGRLNVPPARIDGKKVDINQIEACIFTIPSIDAVMVMVHEQQIVACVATNGDADKEALLDTCHATAKQMLPSFMLPSHYLVLGSMPSSNNGKTGFKVLRDLVEEHCNNESSSETSFGMDSVIDLSNGSMRGNVKGECEASA